MNTWLHTCTEQDMPVPAAADLTPFGDEAGCFADYGGHTGFFQISHYKE